MKTEKMNGLWNQDRNEIGPKRLSSGFLRKKNSLRLEISDLHEAINRLMPLRR